jgi:hypothetical protein
MEVLAVLFGGIGILVAFDALAFLFGADSRDSIGDDHRRGSTVQA